jgi:hypothetical protein
MAKKKKKVEVKKKKAPRGGKKTPLAAIGSGYHVGAMHKGVDPVVEKGIRQLNKPSERGRARVRAHSPVNIHAPETRDMYRSAGYWEGPEGGALQSKNPVYDYDTDAPTKGHRVTAARRQKGGVIRKKTGGHIVDSYDY